MKTKSLFAVMFLFLFMLSLPAWAANHYVREGATGTNNGSDWTNAFTDLPATLVRGDIYYVADGNYCPNGYSFDDAIDGEKYIKVLKATAASHGTDIGWNNFYGDGQAVFTESIAIRTSYIVFDGVVGGIPVNGTIFPDTAAYGFSVVPKNIHGVDHVLINAPHSADIDHIQISHCLLISQGEDWDNGAYRQCGIYVGGDFATHDYLISHNYIKNGTLGLLLYHNSNTIVENNYFMSNWSSAEAHGELVAAGCNLDDVIFRNNVFYEPTPYAIGAIHSGDPSPEEGNERWQVYNNIVIGSVSIVKLNAAFGNADSAHPNRIVNCDFHHNVFYNMDFGRGAIFIGYLTGDVAMNRSRAYNNIFYKVKDVHSGMNYTPGSLIYENNAYYDCDGIFTPGPTDEVHTGIDPFVNSAQFNFRLKGPTQPGKILSPPYDIDYAGITRGLDGNWDRGAYEFALGLYLSSPIGGEIWVQGFSHAITWSSSGVTEPVKVELLRSGVTTTIADNVPVADGSYAWSIPNGQTPGNDYTVKLTAGSYADTSDVFTIAAPAAPIVHTLPAQSVTTSSVSLRGTVHPMGLATTYYFEYGLTTTYGSETAETTLAAGDQVTSVQASIAGLKASTLYHFRLTATNNEGSAYGNDLTFTTSGDGGGGGGGDAGGGGGGGGGCFIAAVQDLSLWFMVFGLAAGWLAWMWRRAKNLKGHL